MQVEDEGPVITIDIGAILIGFDDDGSQTAMLSSLLRQAFADEKKAGDPDELIASLDSDNEAVYNPNPKLSRHHVYQIEHDGRKIKVRLSNSIQQNSVNKNHFDIIKHGRKRVTQAKMGTGAVIGQGIAGKVKESTQYFELNDDKLELKKQNKVVKIQSLVRLDGESASDWQKRVEEKMQLVTREDDMTRAVHPSCDRTIIRHHTKEGVETVTFQSYMPHYGKDFDDLIGEGDIQTYSDVRIYKLCERMFSALARVESKSIIHRDIKPQNMMLDSKGNVRIIDFGVGRYLTESDQRAEGSIDFLSPEEMQTEVKTSSKSDVYALCLVLAKCLSGKPFHPHADALPKGKSVELTELKVEDIRRYLPEEKISDAAISKIHEMIQRGLSDAPDQRPTANELKQFFENIQQELVDDQMRIIDKVYRDKIARHVTAKTQPFFDKYITNRQISDDDINDIFRGVLNEYMGGGSASPTLSLLFQGRRHHHADTVAKVLSVKKENDDLFDDLIDELQQGTTELNPDGTLVEILEAYSDCLGGELMLNNMNDAIRRNRQTPKPT